MANRTLSGVGAVRAENEELGSFSYEINVSDDGQRRTVDGKLDGDFRTLYSLGNYQKLHLTLTTGDEVEFSVSRRGKPVVIEISGPIPGDD